ncbi:sugar ABC transporter permease [Rhizobium laguerreae]|uniref:Carbohydrate ABC transporter membrane protein 1 (CUT1 family) n=1 Tax=Rhizobium laguerreae TaxID=1076926 RepID=A0AAX2QG07_9HYPH|nr:sugar ABC transporter permease [Rhizobium laguerreae]MBY3088357.1 sugar ABC transporter permease [Rhizobium laguerreae]MBY3149338.1 sugar ABC transporter permease [Rhizobium laguerreae]MBY3530204.1 sugar ABC transporter permease [Rhizobium laguerreae]NKM32042.1 ABC transporter permease subunit [Rhizobium laguerreae]TCU19469.1 carbohydrate ABC transporter membrane protein 1 (CUT1 family) [Rhizobium laguerreae]
MATTTTFKATDAQEAQPANWTRWLDLSDRSLAVLLLFPAAILLALIIVYPVCRLAYTSFFNLSLTSGLPAEFVGLDNYRLMIADPVFWETTWNTVLITLITVPGALLVGLGLALMANLPFAMQWPVRLSLLIPWALPLSFAGLIFAWFFHSEYGVVNDMLNRLGFEGIIWFNSPNWAFAAICLTIIWKTSSFMALIILAGLQTIPRSLYEAADVDGAGRLRQFFEITLPLLKPSIVVALIFRTITALQTFDIPYMMTGGGPGTSTSTLAMYIHQNTVSFLDLGYGSALAVVMFALSMCVTAVYLRMIRTKE